MKTKKKQSAKEDVVPRSQKLGKPLKKKEKEFKKNKKGKKSAKKRKFVEEGYGEGTSEVAFDSFKPIKAKKEKRFKKRLGAVEPEDENEVVELEGPEMVDLIEEKEDEEVLDVDEEVLLQDVTPPRPPLVKAVKKKSKKMAKVPKIRRMAASEKMEENYMIVPWESSEEWTAVCLQLHARSYEDVISKIAVWQRRVPNLPVGVEATMFLLEALVYDQKLVRSSGGGGSGVYTEDQARALYSLAIIRYLNHVNHLAAQSLGETTSRPAQELAAIMDTPDWLVSLRNDVSHGPKAPSIEVLRMGGVFVLKWLKDKYWKLPVVEDDKTNQPAASNRNDPFTIIANQSDDIINVPQKISSLLAAYVAARIYKKRHQSTIHDPDIVSQIITSSSDSPSSVKTKTAVASLKTALRGYLVSHPSVFCEVMGKELVPSGEFYQDFKTVFCSRKFKGDGGDDENMDEDAHVFEQLYLVWMPLVKMVELKGRLVEVLGHLCGVEVVSGVGARWVEVVEEGNLVMKKKVGNQLCGILKGVVKRPNLNSRVFLERFFRLTEPRIGSDAVEKLNTLVNIWLEGQEEGLTRKQKRAQAAVSASSSHSKFFSLDDVAENGQGSADDAMDIDRMGSAGNVVVAWAEDRRGEEFWRNIPLGGRV